jgi:hypothetical protein
MTHVLVWTLLALALVDCGKYGRPSRIRSNAQAAPAPASAPAPVSAPAEQCEEPSEKKP